MGESAGGRDEHQGGRRGQDASRYFDASIRSGVLGRAPMREKVPSRCCRSRSAPGSSPHFPRDRPRPRPWPGRRSRRASMCCWSRRPGRARRWPRSWRSSTGSFGAQRPGRSRPGSRCVYVSPLRSLGYDIERNLAEPLAGDRHAAGARGSSPVRVGVRTGDTSAYDRRKLRDEPPHILITTPESLSLLLSQEAWLPHWRRVEHLIVDEVHALAPTKRGADLAVSLERLSAHARRDPCRVGLSATCRPAEAITRFLVGPSRTCRVSRPPCPAGTPPIEIERRVADQGRRGAPPRPELPTAAQAAAPGAWAQPHDGRLREYAGVHREDHA